MRSKDVRSKILLADSLDKMGLTPTRHGNSAYIKPREDGHDCIATHVDDFIVVGKDSKKHDDHNKQTFNLRSKVDADCFLTHDARRKKNGLWVTSAKKSIHKAISKVE